MSNYISLNKEGQLIKNLSKKFSSKSDYIFIDKFLYSRKGQGLIFPICVVLLLLSFVMTFFVPFLSILVQILVYVIFLCEKIFFTSFIDNYFSQEGSCNAEIVVRAKKEAKTKVVLFCNVEKKNVVLKGLLGKNLSKIILIVNIIAVIYYLIFSIVSLLILGVGVNLPTKSVALVGVVGAIFLPSLILFLIEGYYKTKNVSFVEDLPQYCENFVENAYSRKFENIEFSLVIDTGRELGLIGQKHFVKTNKKRLKEVPTIFITMVDDAYYVSTNNVLAMSNDCKGFFDNKDFSDKKCAKNCYFNRFVGLGKKCFLIEASKNEDINKKLERFLREIDY